jgi:hypothetical protein
MVFSPSSAERWLMGDCTAISIQLSLTYPEIAYEIAVLD